MLVATCRAERVASSPLSKREPLSMSIRQRVVALRSFYVDRMLETVGRSGAGWSSSSRQRGFSPTSLATGCFPPSNSAYLHALQHDPKD
jgi:hypothetical protein